MLRLLSLGYATLTYLGLRPEDDISGRRDLLVLAIAYN